MSGWFSFNIGGLALFAVASDRNLENSSPWFLLIGLRVSSTLFLCSVIAQGVSSLVNRKEIIESMTADVYNCEIWLLFTGSMVVIS